MSDFRVINNWWLYLKSVFGKYEYCMIEYYTEEIAKMGMNAMKMDRWELVRFERP